MNEIIALLVGCRSDRLDLRSQMSSQQNLFDSHMRSRSESLEQRGKTTLSLVHLPPLCPTQVDSYYLISEGNSSDDARETLRDNVVKTRLSTQSTKPFNVVSLFCNDNDTQTYLRSIAQSANGRFVARTDNQLICLSVALVISATRSTANSRI